MTSCHLYFLSGDLIAMKTVVRLRLELHVLLEANQDVAADKPTGSMPVADGGLSVLRGYLRRGEAFLRRFMPDCPTDC
jgi:hypothetical protein